MKKILYVLCIFSIITVSVFTSESFAQPSPSSDIFFIFVQVTLRNSDGNLVTYMESNKLIDVNEKIINDSLNQFSSSMEIPIFELNDTKFQVFIIETITELDSTTMFANAHYYVTIEERIYSGAQFSFDSFLTSPGDEATVVWTIAKLV